MRGKCGALPRRKKENSECEYYVDLYPKKTVDINQTVYFLKGKVRQISYCIVKN
jgi:hypothetical protein